MLISGAVILGSTIAPAATTYRSAEILSGTIGVVTFLALLQAWGLDVLAWFHSGQTGARLLSALITIAIATAAAVLVWEGANAVIDWRLELLGRSGRATRLRTLLPLLRTALLVTIAIVIGLTALSELGVDIEPLLAGAGIVGVAIGFGSQTLVHDVITGMFLLLENEIQVGDIVTAAGFPVTSRTCRSARSGCAQQTARSTSPRSAW
jgi:small-conductance mechanosensitive channel